MQQRILQCTGRHPVFGCWGACAFSSQVGFLVVYALGQGEGPCWVSAGSHQPEPKPVEADRHGLPVLLGLHHRAHRYSHTEPILLFF